MLEDLRDRLARTRWPSAAPGAAWEQGTELGWLRDVGAYWANEFDWRSHERRLNSYPQFVADGSTEVTGCRRRRSLHRPSPPSVHECVDPCSGTRGRARAAADSGPLNFAMAATPAVSVRPAVTGHSAGRCCGRKSQRRGCCGVAWVGTLEPGDRCRLGSASCSAGRGTLTVPRRRLILMPGAVCAAGDR